MNGNVALIGLYCGVGIDNAHPYVVGAGCAAGAADGDSASHCGGDDGIVLQRNAVAVSPTTAAAAGEGDMTAIARHLCLALNACIPVAVGAVAHAVNGNVALVGLYLAARSEDAYPHVDAATRAAGAADGDGPRQCGGDL